MTWPSPYPQLVLCLWLMVSAFAAAQAPAAPQPAGGAATSKASTQDLVLVLDLDEKNLQPGEGALINGFIGQALDEAEGLQVITQRDMRQLVDIEAERAALGCDDASCLSEIAGAMGAGYVVFGTAGRLGELIVVQLALFDSQQGRSIAREDARAPRPEDLPDAVSAAARRLLVDLHAARAEARGEAVADASPAGSPMRETGDGGEPSAARSPVAPGNDQEPARASGDLEPDSDGWLGTTLLVGGGAALALGLLAALVSGALVGGVELALADTSGLIGTDGKDLLLVAGWVPVITLGLAAVVAAGGGALALTSLVVE